MSPSTQEGLLNKKMKKVLDALVGMFVRELSINDQLFLFDGRTTIYDLAKSVLYVCCKGAYHHQAEKHSLRYYLDKMEVRDDARDSERMVYQRTLHYINELRIKQYDYLAENGFTFEGLLPPDMVTIKDKLEGYKFDEYRFWEISNVHDMTLARDIVDRKLTSKNYSTNKLANALKQYDEVVAVKKAEWKSGGEGAFVSYMAFHTLESLYAIEFVYGIAAAMEQNNVQSLDDIGMRVYSHCGTVSEHSLLDWINSHVNKTVLTDQSFLVRRLDYIDDVIALQGRDLLISSIRAFEARAAVAFMMKGFTYKGIPIQEWFNQNTSQDDWMSVSRYCNDFECWHQGKDYQNKRIVSNMKRIYTAICHDYKNPEIRS